MKKNILISVYNMEIGGIERSLINMLESFDYKKYNVDLLIFHHAGDFMSFIPEKVKVLPEVGKFTIFRKPISQCLTEGHYALSFLRIMAKYTAILKSQFRRLEEGSGYIQMQLALKYSLVCLPKLDKVYDVAISYAWPHDILAYKVNAKKKIAWIHTDYSKLEIDNLRDLTVWNRYDYIAAVSDECKNSFLSQYPSLTKKVMVIENLTSPDFIKKMANEVVELKNTQEKDFKIVSVGRLSFVKGFDMAVEALKILHDKGLTNIKWYLVGYGGYEEKLKELIASKNLQDTFILLGKKSNPYTYIKACDLYVQPSRYEGKAVTVTEAMILGKVILITNYPTSKSQVENGVNGYICDLSVSGLVEGIERLYRNKDLRDEIVKNLNNKDFNNSCELQKLYGIIDNLDRFNSFHLI